MHWYAFRQKKATKIGLKTQHLEDFIPLQKFGGHASVCSVPQAYLLTPDQSQQVHRVSICANKCVQHAVSINT